MRVLRNAFARDVVAELVARSRRDAVGRELRGMAYRALREGELAVLPNTGHLISASAVQVSIEFLERHQLARQPAPASG